MDRLARLWKLLHENAPGDEIQKVGAEIGRELDSMVAEVTCQKRILEDILALKTPVAKAWKEFTTPPPNGRPHEAVREILKELLAKGSYQVSTRIMLDLLAKRTVSHTWKNPGTGVGNVIRQTPGWKKVAVGVYEFRGVTEVK